MKAISLHPAFNIKNIKLMSIPVYGTQILCLNNLNLKCIITSIKDPLTLNLYWRVSIDEVILHFPANLSIEDAVKLAEKMVLG